MTRRAPLRVWIFCLLAASPLVGDVVVLKDGTRIAGTVVKKPAHYEVTTEAGLRTYLKEEVERIATSPRELLGDADVLFDEARQGFQKALDDKAEDSNPAYKEALAKVTRARQTYVAARELFPDDKYAELDQKLLQIMQLTRLLRERLHTEVAVNPEAPVAAPSREATLPL